MSCLIRCSMFFIQIGRRTLFVLTKTDVAEQNEAKPSRVSSLFIL